MQIETELQDLKAPTVRTQFNKVFMLSDLHFGIRSNSIEWLENELDFFYNFYIPFLKKNKEDGDILFVLGDWHDNRQLLDINVLNKSIDLISDLSSILPVHMLVGNHDIYKKNDTDVNSLVSFKKISNVQVYEKPTLVTNDKCKILVIPWVGNAEKEEMIAKENKADYVFAHTDLVGFVLDNGLPIKYGSDLKMGAEARMVFSGHIHKRQENRGSVYLGSPYCTKRSDIGNSKGVYVLDTKNHVYTFHRNDYSPVFQRVRLEGLLNLTLEEAHKLLENNYTDIIVPDRYMTVFNLTRFIDTLDGCKYKKIEAGAEKIKLMEDLDQIEANEEIKDIMTLLEANIDSTAKDEETIRVLKQINKEYYDKARSSRAFEDLI